MSSLKGTQAARDLMTNVRAHKGGGMAAPLTLAADSGRKAPAERDQATRHKQAQSGVAMATPGHVGAYPIENQTQLNDAVHDWIRTGRPAAVKSHIQKRARALNLELPENMEAKGAPDELDVARGINARRGK